MNANFQSFLFKMPHSSISRGIEYFKAGRINRVNVNGDTILASVTGSSNIYDVIINKLNDNHLNAQCTCPVGGLCKHIAAVIYHCQHHKIDFSEKILSMHEYLNSFKETCEIIDLKNTNMDSVQLMDFDSYSQIFNSAQRVIINDPLYKLCFVIATERLAYSEKWIIFPHVRIVKKNGMVGRFQKFNNKVDENAISDAEKKLFNIIRKSSNDNLPLIYAIDVIIENDFTNIYLNYNSEFRLLKKYCLNKLKINFQISKLNLYNKNKIDYSPEYFIFFENKWLECKIENPIFDTDIVFIIDTKNDIILYRKNDSFFSSLIKFITGAKYFSFHEIKNLEKIIKNNSREETIELNFEHEQVKFNTVLPIPIIYLDTNIVNYLKIQVGFDYKGNIFLIDENNYYESKNYLINKNSNQVFSRNFDFEKLAIDFIKSFLGVRKNNYMTIQDYNFQIDIPLTTFIEKYSERLIKEGYQIKIANKIFNKKKHISKIKIIIRESGMDWFNIGLRFNNQNNEEIDFKLNKHNINELLQGYIILDEQYIEINKDILEKIKNLAEEGFDKNNEIKISKFNLHFINKYYELFETTENTGIDTQYKIYQSLTNFKKINVQKVPKKFNAKLRHYQNAGYDWLLFLNEFGINGCLADDMGLGKTVQTLAMIQKLKENKLFKTSLIIAPITVMPNWEDEIKKFAPNITFYRHSGSQRIKDHDFINKHDLIIVSYATLRNDVEFFKEYDFYYIILDESQNIKNPDSLIFKAVKLLKSKHKLSLTGTPIENNTHELWAQMDFLNPGLLNDRKNFEINFAKPIENGNDKEITQKLKNMIFPFILRRKKQDVLKDLPEKEEIILHAEMEPEQAQAYKALNEHYKQIISKEMETDGIKKSFFKIFEALLKLRQMAIFPSMVNEQFKNIESCKFNILKDLIEEILSENHKILIFSQFIEPLQKIKTHLDENKIIYSYIDGSTKDRHVEIKNFQENDEYKVFLLSLKSGSLGINLTAADYVILFDPWWNPAIEAQAIDRAHRIGQQKKVTAYKIIVKNTVEEKILELQEKKKSLINELISEDAGFFKKLSKEDILNLF